MLKNIGINRERERESRSSRWAEPSGTIFFITFLVFGFLILPGKSLAATVYVSNSASNGYGVGNDANTYAQAQNKATPYATLTKAVSTAVTEGDTIVINDGTYTETSSVITARDNLTITNDSALGTSFSVIIQASAGTRVLHLAKVNTGIGYTIGPIVIDANNSRGICVTFDSSAKINAVVFSGTKFLNPVTNFMSSGAHLKNLTLNNHWVAQSNSTGAGIFSLAPGSDAANGTYTFTDGIVTVTDSTVASLATIYYVSSITEHNFIISNLVMNLSGTGNIFGILASGANTYDIYDIYGNEININTSTYVAPISIRHHASLNTISCHVYNNSGTADSATDGYFIQIGNDSDVAPATTISDVLVYDNNFTRGNHGYYLGWITGGKVYQNIGNNMVVGLVAKHTTSCQYDRNILNGGSFTSGALRAKGGNGDIFYNNTVKMDASTNTGWGSYLTDTSLGMVFKNNIIYASANTISRLVAVSTDSDAIFSNNHYYDGETPAAGDWLYQTTSYDNLSSWQSVESTAKYGDPLISDPEIDFTLLPTSPAIDAGTGVGLATDYAGNSIYGVPDIGAYEYQPPYTFAVNDIPTTGSVRLYSNGKYRMTTASSSTAVADFSVTPTGGYYATTTQYLDITIDSWSTTGSKNKQWTATSTAGDFLTQATSTIYAIGNLAPSTYYTFKLDGTASTTAIINNTQCANGICLSDTSGNLTFTYQGGYSTHIFALDKDVTAPAAFNLAEPASNSLALSSQPTLSWYASSDSESGLANYRLYIDDILDTDGISASATSVTPANALACGSHTWHIQARDNNGNSVNSDTFNLLMPCSGGSSSGSASQPQAPTGGFSVLISNGASNTSNSTVTLNLKGGANTAKMAISNFPDFKNASQETYASSKIWNICQGLASCLPGVHTVYVKYYTQYGVSSNVVSCNVTYSPSAVASVISNLSLVKYPGSPKVYLIQNGQKRWIIDEKTFLANGFKWPDIKTVDSNVFYPDGDSITTAIVNNQAKPFTLNLKIGSIGAEVRRLQTALKELGFFSYPQITGYFGAVTKAAVIKFQKANKIQPANGTFGQATRKALNELMAKK